MGRTELKSHQIHDGSIQNVDIDITSPGKALITKVVAGDGITISSTGADEGTGIVTISTSSLQNTGIKQLTFAQQSSVTEWNIVHNLGTYPEVTLITADGYKVLTDMYYETLNNIRIVFDTPFSGIAALTAYETLQGNFVQLTASDTWSIVHNLNRYPDVIIFDTSIGNLRVYGDIIYISLNEIRIEFGYPVAGELNLI